MVAAGGFHSLCLTKKGEVFSWGRGLFGQLGLGERKNEARVGRTTDTQTAVSAFHPHLFTNRL